MSGSDMVAIPRRDITFIMNGENIYIISVPREIVAIEVLKEAVQLVLESVKTEHAKAGGTGEEGE